MPIAAIACFAGISRVRAGEISGHFNRLGHPMTFWPRNAALDGDLI
jgi:hypothetical protein